MFRSQRRPLVYTQTEHARLSATIAAAWGNGAFALPPIPFDALVLGTALHDRGYPELDTAAIGEAPSDEWLAIQENGYTPRGEDPIVDLLVAQHVRRLVSWKTSHEQLAEPLLAEIDEALPRIREAAGVDESVAAMADSIVNFCDRVAFDFCVELPAEGGVGVVPRLGAPPVDVEYAVDGSGSIEIGPWPLSASTVTDVVVGYAANGYPGSLKPSIELYRIKPLS